MKKEVKKYVLYNQDQISRLGMGYRTVFYKETKKFVYLKDLYKKEWFRIKKIIFDSYKDKLKLVDYQTFNNNITKRDNE